MRPRLLPIMKSRIKAEKDNSIRKRRMWLRSKIPDIWIRNELLKRPIAVPRDTEFVVIKDNVAIPVILKLFHRLAMFVIHSAYVWTRCTDQPSSRHCDDYSEKSIPIFCRSLRSSEDVIFGLSRFNFCGG